MSTTSVEQSLQYAHLASENGRTLSGTKSMPRHIVSPSNAARTVCGVKLDRDYVIASRMFVGEKLCGSCERMKSSALYDLRLRADKNLHAKKIGGAR